MATPKYTARLLRTAVGAAVAGVVVLAGSSGAWADVKISPVQGVQGGTVDLTFQVPDDRGAAYTSKVEVLLPADAPVGEVDPLSVDGWAPLLSYRNLATPVPGIHSSALVSSVVSAVTWVRATGTPATAGTIAKLTVSMGPLPTSASQMAFTVLQTYSDNVVRRWSATSSAGAVAAGAGPVLALKPATAADASAAADGMAGMAGMDGMAGMGDTSATAAATGQTGADSPAPEGALKRISGGLAGAFGAGLTGGVLVTALLGGWLLTRSRRTAAPTAESKTTETTHTPETRSEADAEIKTEETVTR